jgi:hypothetical protein
MGIAFKHWLWCGPIQLLYLIRWTEDRKVEYSEYYFLKSAILRDVMAAM